MDERAFVIGRDARGAVVHVRRRDDGECIGCIEAGLFEIVRTLVMEERGGRGQRQEGHRTAPAATGGAQDTTRRGE